jgi:hypothetical protein
MDRLGKMENGTPNGMPWRKRGTILSATHPVYCVLAFKQALPLVRCTPSIRWAGNRDSVDEFQLSVLTLYIAQTNRSNRW